MKQLVIPSFFHEIFGPKQKLSEVCTILLFGAGLTTTLYVLYPEMYLNIPLWRSVIAFLFIFDIFAGCLANFTVSTNNYYAENPKKRLIFISIHFHIILVALLLGTDILYASLVWMYTIVCAFIINSIININQVFVAGFLLALGLAWIPMLSGIKPFMLIFFLLFMLKVLFSFSVNHYKKRVGF